VRRPAIAEVVVVGAGFGGLGAALALAERGARPVVVEALTYPGGCASTFRRAGFRFEAGATLCAGFAPGQLFHRWIARHGLDVRTDRIDPVVDLRTPDLRLEVPAERARFVARMLGLPGAPVERLRAFLDEQDRVATTMWGLLDDPALLPPLSPAAVLRHLASAPRYAALTRVAAQPLASVLRRHRVDGFAPLRAYLESFAQITVQCGVEEAEAPVALATADYPFRGAAHVQGGVGRLADGLVAAIRGLGGEVRFATRAVSIGRADGLWRVATSRGDIDAPAVVANVLPQSLGGLLGLAPREDDGLARLAAEVEGGWGAVMLYLVVRAPRGATPAALHLDLTDDPSAPYVEGNHVFASISAADDTGRAPEGCRTMTVSTHVRVADLRRLDEAGRAARIAAIQRRMRATLDRLAPEWTADVVHGMTASPRTFERFTFRPHGLVGGVPRRAGWHNYRGLAPVEVRPGLWLAGDSVFPGQSTLAAAIGGTRVAEAVVRSGRVELQESLR
jgi:phytoene dehydrogenase-like protein